MATQKGASKKRTKKSAVKAADDKITRAYTANMSSLKGLETTCEADEANLTARIVSLELGTDDDTDVTVGDYEEDDTTILGELSFEEYKTDVDEQSLKAIHKDDTFLFKGNAFVKSMPVKVLVFRDKQ